MPGRPTTNLVGRIFDRLRVTSEWNDTRRKWCVCVCRCGKEKIVRSDGLIRGSTRSCGCFHLERVTNNPPKHITHGLSRTVEFEAWTAMKKRCYKPNNVGFYRYGAR